MYIYEIKHWWLNLFWIQEAELFNYF